MYQFDRTVNRIGTHTIKWDLLEHIYGDANLLPFWIADTDFELMPELQAAIKERAAHPCFGYTYAPERYYDKFIEWNLSRNGLTIQNDEILPVPGVLCALAFAIHTLTNPGDGILFFTPVYDPFMYAVQGHNRVSVTSSLVRANRDHHGRAMCLDC